MMQKPKTFLHFLNRLRIDSPNLSGIPFTWHDVVNTGSEPLRLYAIYAPVHHAAGKVHGTFDDAEKDEESGGDEPPAWSVQPPQTRPDRHG